MPFNINPTHMCYSLSERHTKAGVFISEECCHTCFSSHWYIPYRSNGMLTPTNICSPTVLNLPFISLLGLFGAWTLPVLSPFTNKQQSVRSRSGFGEEYWMIIVKILSYFTCHFYNNSPAATDEGQRGNVSMLFLKAFLPFPPHWWATWNLPSPQPLSLFLSSPAGVNGAKCFSLVCECVQTGCAFFFLLSIACNTEGGPGLCRPKLCQWLSKQTDKSLLIASLACKYCSVGPLYAVLDY